MWVGDSERSTNSSREKCRAGNVGASSMKTTCDRSKMPRMRGLLITISSVLSFESSTGDAPMCEWYVCPSISRAAAQVHDMTSTAASPWSRRAAAIHGCNTRDFPQPAGPRTATFVPLKKDAHTARCPWSKEATMGSMVVDGVGEGKKKEQDGDARGLRAGAWR